MASQQLTTKMQQADFLFCEHVLEEFKRFKHRKYVASFKQPVDIVTVPTYLNVIRQPMDLSTIAFKLGSDVYDSAASFKADFELMFDNCDRFNAGHPPSSVYEHGRQFRDEFNQVWLDQHNWLKRVHPGVFIQATTEEQDGSMDEPLPKRRRRQSSRLINSTESSPTLPSPYTAASVVRTTTSTPATPVSGRPKGRASKASTFKHPSSRAQSTSSTANQITATQTNASQAAELLAAEPDATASEAAEPDVKSPDGTSPANNDRSGLDSTSNNPWDEFQERLRSMVTEEATNLLNDPTIKHPSDDHNKLAKTMWDAISADNNNPAPLEVGKASFGAWVSLAVEELSKVAIRDVGNQVQNETKKALIVVMERHYEFLKNKLERHHEELRARLED
ncbi:unnamed protein product [Aureobasidium mustum]|uniref:Bromo domain-containing protein n=1 Tax=Aureobasidium mustum TaxID=2773714 RepID=A0A9N8PLH4_9PEZI|nr:unnamed protein product [Aureobasidium mustum]